MYSKVAMNLKKKHKVIYLKVNEEGMINLKDLEDCLKRISLVSIMHANNETGVSTSNKRDWKFV